WSGLRGAGRGRPAVPVQRLAPAPPQGGTTLIAEPRLELDGDVEAALVHLHAGWVVEVDQIQLIGGQPHAVQVERHDALASGAPGQGNTVPESAAHRHAGLAEQ